MKKKIGYLPVLFIILACGATAPAATQSVDTMVTQTLQALTSVPAATPQPEQITPDGTRVETAEISLLIPNGVANDAASASVTDVELPYINPGSGDMPQHIKLTLDLYALSNTSLEPQIMIFRSNEYSGYSELTALMIGEIQSMQYSDGQPLPEHLGSDFSAQIHGLNFQNGHGVRYLTQVMTNFTPINNRDFYYYYQGMTDDGKFFVQAVLPVNAAYLPADDNPNTPLPTDGIPFSTEDFGGYLNAVTLKLNSADSFSFSPYLNQLDMMIESMLVKGF
ncbi:MAG: hypothetical protein IPG44_08230 [Anaerolineales bacterium]|jgi:hypothetical protein|nr:hypothetical protein [Anaerolineales bacterium]MCC6987231.1 hypothetical protein [Anaerolineales bacterium]